MNGAPAQTPPASSRPSGPRDVERVEGAEPGRISARRQRLLARFDEVAPRWLSLDVFDTLLARPFERPTDVFVEVHRVLTEASEHVVGVDARSFARLRVEAEAAARRARPGGEVTIDEISAELSRALRGSVAAATLAELEVATERAFIQLDADVAALVRHAHARGVPYVLVSDMYLRGEHIVDLLRAAAAAAQVELPPPARVYVSGERRTNKAGRMFDEVLGELGCAPHELLHVGDHAISDLESPRGKGIPAEHVFRETPLLERVFALEAQHLGGGAPTHYDVGLRTLRAKAVTSAQADAREPLDHFRYGALVLGPVLTSFAEWIVDDCVRRDQHVAFCLMREGHLLAPLVERAAREVGFELDVRKLWASRYAIRAASFHAANEPELRAYFTKRHNVSLETVGRDLGVDLDRLRAASGVPHAEKLSNQELDRVVLGIVGDRALREQMLAASAEKRRLLFDYFRDAGVFDDDRMTIVDLGWGGTIQRTLARAFADHPRPKHLRGLYLATHERLLELPLASCSAEGFLFHLGQPAAQWALLQRTPEILEHACMPRVGSFRGIGAEGAPECFPQVIPPRQLDDIAELQRGILHFAELWLPEARKRRAHLTHADEEATRARLRAIIARSLQDPTPEEVALFASWDHDPNDGSEEREQLLGDEALRRRARFMTYSQIMELSWLDVFWPQGLARLLGKSPEQEPALLKSALRREPLRAGANLLARSASAIASFFERK